MKRVPFFAAAMVLVAAMLGIGTGALAGEPPRIPADFNGDGYADLAIGSPNEGLGPIDKAGGVHVLYGSATGLTATGAQMWTQDSPGIPDHAEIADYFGIRLATGDFDADGYSDLAVGAHNEGNYGYLGTGAVHILYGSPEGLTAARAQFWDQNSPGILGTATGEAFGYALAVGDFDADGHDDLAVGAVDDTAGGVGFAGGVNVIYGSGAGLAADGNQLWNQASPGVADDPEEFDDFGNSMAAADLNGDGYPDLAIGIPNEGLGSQENVGAVEVLYSSAQGLTADGSQFWTQHSQGIRDQAESGDFFGQRVAAGDMNLDGYADLAVGVPFEDVGGIEDSGAVNVIYGSPAGLAAPENQFWSQDRPGVAGRGEAFDQLGFGLTVADFDLDGFADLVAGAYDDRADTNEQVGALNVLRGSAGGLSAFADQFWSQNFPGVREVSEVGDLFGIDTASGDFNGDGYIDLAVGAGGDSVGAVPGAGVVNVIYGAEGGLQVKSPDDQVWSEDGTGVGDGSEEGDGFGLEVGGAS